MSKSCKVEKRRLHKRKQQANVTAKLESYEDLEARMEHMEFLIQGHFDKEPGHAMTRAEWDAIAQDSAKKASDARELLRLKKKEEDEMRTKAKALAVPESPIDDVFRALGGEMDEAIPDVHSEVCLYIRKLITLANDHEMLKGASFDVTPDTRCRSNRAYKVHNQG